MEKQKKKNNEELVKEYQSETSEKKKKIIANELYKKVEKMIYKMVNIVKNKFYVHPTVEEDLFLEANYIFMRCLIKFNTTKKVKFSTYLGDALYYELKRFNKKQMTHVNNSYDLEIDEILQAKSNDLDAIMDDITSVDKIQEILLKLNKEQKITDKQFNTIIEEYGFFGKKQKTRREIAEDRQCSLQNIGFLYRKAIKRIKDEIRNTDK